MSGHGQWYPRPTRWLDLAARALPYAELLAERCHAELLLATAVQPRPRLPEGWTEAQERAYAEAEERLAELELTGRARGLSVSSAVTVGEASQSLLEIARANAVSLIVMATHGRSGPSRWVVGSVAEQLLRRTHLPVLLLTPAALAGGGPERLLARLAVATDGSAVSRRIYPVAAFLARRLALSLVLIQALDPVAPLGEGAPDPLTDVIPRVLVQDFAEHSGDHAPRAPTSGGTDQDVEAVVERGPAAVVILRVAAERGAGWLALASHGRGGLGGLVLGSTALAVLHRATLPVLLTATDIDDCYRLGTADQAL